MSYDPLRRLYQVTGSSARRFLYDGVDIITELDTSGNVVRRHVVRRYVHGPGVDEPLVRYDGSGTSTKTSLMLTSADRSSWSEPPQVPRPIGVPRVLKSTA